MHSYLSHIQTLQIIKKVFLDRDCREFKKQAVKIIYKEMKSELFSNIHGVFSVTMLDFSQKKKQYSDFEL